MTVTRMMLVVVVMAFIAHTMSMNGGQVEARSAEHSGQRAKLLTLLRALADENGYVNVKRSNAELVNGLLSMPSYEDMARAGKK